MAPEISAIIRVRLSNTAALRGCPVVKRSEPKTMLAIFQPSLIFPIMFLTGTRTLSKCS